MLLLGKNTQQIFTPTSVTCHTTSTFWPCMLGFHVGYTSDTEGNAFRHWGWKERIAQHPTLFLHKQGGCRLILKKNLKKKKNFKEFWKPQKNPLS